MREEEREADRVTGHTGVPRRVYPLQCYVPMSLMRSHDHDTHHTSAPARHCTHAHTHTRAAYAQRHTPVDGVSATDAADLASPIRSAPCAHALHPRQVQVGLGFHHQRPRPELCCSSGRQDAEAPLLLGGMQDHAWHRDERLGRALMARLAAVGVCHRTEVESQSVQTQDEHGT